jgi:hypothetical protein
MTKIAQCDVCYWIDADERQKPARYCPSCQAWICEPCIGRPWRRAIAMFLRKINFRLRSVGPLPILIVILMLAPFAHSQSTCGAGLQNLSSLNAVSNIGKVYQNACWDPVGLALTFPNFSGGGGSPSFSAITSGTNITATMTVGTGASLGTSGTGAVTANQLANLTTIPNGGNIVDVSGDGISLGSGFFLFDSNASVEFQSDTPTTGNFTICWGSICGNTLIGTAGSLTSNVGFSTSSVTGTGLLKGNQLQSTVAIGTAPLIVASTTNVANLNASSLGGATFAAPGAIGTTTAGVVKTTTLEAPNVLCSSSSPTISSGFGTSPSIPNVNGSCSFTLNVGTGGTASSGVIAMNATATTGWNCDVHPNGAPQAAAVTYSAPTSTTSVTLTNYTQSTGVALAWTASLVFNISCFGY